ncbi:hypothetical protein RJD38_21685 (plasmid) [Vibrio scophthalmi]|uniref:hypothetical protein n=1 Tax=Vibrio scophthalmi TaxID=45658 RepID=UPI0008099A39|nr:hypothetical protein [Vibrio scophthalmi]ANS88112.1 hypothetical protein VSVS12_04413 [Vibrio scophthalmi]
MMVIPELVSLPHHGKPQSVLRKLKKAWPSKYSLAFVRDSRVCLYTAESAAVVRSEVWREALMGRGVDLRSVVVLDVLSDQSESSQLYCVVIEEGEVVAQWLQNSLNIKENVAILTAKTVLCAVSDEDKVIEGQWCLPLTESEQEALAAYTLKAKKSPLPWVVGGGVAALGLGALLMWPAPSQKAEELRSEPVAVVVADPWGDYRSIMENDHSAAAVFQQVQNLVAMAQLLPPKWKPTLIEVSSGVVTLNIEREPLGQVAMLTAWIDHYPAIKPYITYSRESAVISTPVEKPLSFWAERFIPIEPTQSTLFDTLALLGFEASGVSETKGAYQKTAFSIEKSLTLFDVGVLLGLMSPLPMTVADFSLSPVGDGAWQGGINLSFYGVSS